MMKKVVKLILAVSFVVMFYMILYPSSLISWLANRESLYIIKHNGIEINILRNPGNATNAEYLQIEVNGRIKLNRKSKGEISSFIINDSVIKIFVKPEVDIGKLYSDTILFKYRGEPSPDPK